MSDPYETLGLTPKASIEEIKQKYRKLSLKYHPDRNPDDGGEMFKKINKAYELLSNNDRREDYNMMKKMGIPMDEETFQNVGMVNPNDILNMIFSGGGNVFSMGMPGMTGMTGMTGMSEFNPFKEMGTNIHFTGGRNPQTSFAHSVITEHVDITLEQAFIGCTVGIDVERTISFYGEHNKETEKIYFKIPEGADDNEMILVKDKGNVINGNKGDIQISIRIKKHKDFERDGMDLIYHKTINFKESLCGFSFDLNYINGQTYKINNRKGNIIPQFHEKTVSNLGMRRNDNQGDLIIKFNVEYPDQLSPEQIKAFEEVV